MVGIMMIYSWTPEEDELLICNPNTSATILASQMQTEHGELRHSPRSIGRRRVELARIKANTPPKARLVRKIPTAALPVLQNPSHVKGDSALWLSDIHAPMQDSDFIEKSVRVATAWRIPICILGGDLFDAAAFSKFGHDPEQVFEQELEQAGELLESIASQFERVIWIMGNHERRMFKTLSFQLSVNRVLKMMTSAPNIEVTPFEWLEMVPETSSPWIFCHPMNASIIPGRVPQMIADRRFSDHNVVAGHGHLASIARSSDGNRYAIDSGMCADPSRIAYASLAVSVRPVMVRGSVAVKHGFPYLFSPHQDWAALEGLYGS